MMNIFKSDLEIPNSAVLKPHQGKYWIQNKSPSNDLFFLLLITDLIPLAIMSAVPLFPSVGLLFLMLAETTLSFLLTRPSEYQV